ncbi:hypothetical protein [Nitrosophilus alvini]|uniref:hypothetical protein n=1 Tax=Nitrosophilus alvini TaxID=2714855 RepID=UPI00190BACF9|nr:hypothetical protein [Nitrosophilus alvini]
MRDILPPVFEEGLKHFNGTDIQSLVIITVFLTVVVIFFIVVAVYYSIKREKKIKRRFIHVAKEKNLEEFESEILWLFAKKAKKNPLHVLTMEKEFDSAMVFFLKKYPDKKKFVDSLKAKLGFDIGALIQRMRKK